jgi:hypothetical protein
VPGPSFADVLDDMVRAAPAPDPGPAPGGARRPAFGVPTALLFSRPLTSPTPRWPTADDGIRNAARPRPAHQLDADQRRAFDRLISMGSALPAGFTAEDLRDEYRRLARRFHPDRHARCTALERAQLARCFTEVADACRRLRPVVEPRH